jgi:pyridinium-3,5-biscarboxylic acid mononucleotide sulfurtransferase
VRLLDRFGGASYSDLVVPISPELRRKESQLLEVLGAARRVLVAFSGGVDSSYLALAAHRALGADAMAVTALSPSYPASHRAVAEQVVAAHGIAHRFVATDEMSNPEYRANRPDRCYHCKTELFRVMGALREELGFEAVAYGVNTDDTGDFRPGHRAAAEQGVLSPFLDAGLSKADIRALSREARLPSAELPASACLSSRLPYGTEVTPERLAQVERGEEALRALGFRQVRLRHHGVLARVEVELGELPRALDPSMAQRISAALKPLGFRYVSLDLDGYRTGSLNEVLKISRAPGSGAPV